jgi:hypothetical protein
MFARYTIFYPFEKVSNSSWLRKEKTIFELGPRPAQTFTINIFETRSEILV